MIEPIPYFFNFINRNAIVIKQKSPFFNWINSLYPDTPVNTLEESNVYLIRSLKNHEEIENWLRRNFDKIFQNELNDWHTDEKGWPQKRSFKIFKEWFEYEIRSMILDLEKTIIKKN